MSTELMGSRGRSKPQPGKLRSRKNMAITYAVSTLLAGHKSGWANTQETALCVFTAPLGAEVLDLRAFVNIC